MNSLRICAAAFAASVVVGYAAPLPAQELRASEDSSAVGFDSVLTLAEARARTLARHPALASARVLVDAARARREDAGRRPNPVLSVDVENFGPHEASRRLETTVQLGQTFELGGDREGRTMAADAALALVQADLTVEERSILAGTSERFLDAWALQERLSALRAAESLASEAIRAADMRHRAGAAPVTERVRAEALHVQRTVERERAETELVLARHLLAAQWGDSITAFSRLSPGDEPREATTLPLALSAIQSHPQRLRAAAEVAFHEARLREARAARTLDLDVEFGVRRLSETGTMGFVAGVAMPLPLWNPQSGGVAAAEAEIVAAHARERATMLLLNNELEAAIGRMVVARSAREAIRTRIQPAAEEALRQVSVGYRAGRHSYTDLIDAQRAVRDAELALTDANVDLWRAQVALDRLVGVPIPDSTINQEQP